MVIKRQLFLLTSAVLFLLVACTGKPAAQTTAKSTDMTNGTPPVEDVTEADIETASAATAEPTTSPSPTPREILWQDDFSDVNSGWERYNEFDGVLDYVESEGVYQMQVEAENNLWWVYKDETLPDVSMSVDVRQVDGPEGSLFGLMCRYNPETNQGFVFLISTEGKAGVGLSDQGFKSLRGGELTQFDVIETGMNALNTVEADCIGDSLTMRVNGETLFTLPAGDLLGEDIGLAVATVNGAGTNVYFDNMTVYQP